MIQFIDAITYMVLTGLVAFVLGFMFGRNT